MSTVFISYSHKDEAWKDRLLPHLKTLEQADLDIKIWHDRMIDGGDKWYPGIEQAMKDAAVAILLISADYLSSAFCVKEEVPFLLKRQEQEGMLLIPVLVRQCPWKAHRWLADRQMLPLDGKSIAIDFPGDNSDSIFCQVAELVFGYFEKTRFTLAIAQNNHPLNPMSAGKKALKRKSLLPASEEKYPYLSENHIDLSRLPETGKALFGRDEELSLLDKVWNLKENSSESNTRILAFIAQGGVGKSTLVNHWLQDIARENYRGADSVFGWSFYSQGALSEGMASTDTFINEALSFFGGEEGKKLADSPATAWDKGEWLAKFIGGKRSLLIIDGMEPLQSPHPFERGKLHDPALETLLKCLARKSEGLCLITTREPLFNLEGQPGVLTRDIEQITPEAGRALLRTARVVGSDSELEKLAERFGPHALSISLLGVYLHEIDLKHGIEPAQLLESLPGSTPLDRVLAGFEKWLGASGELEVLRLTGLFDRPIDSGCLQALKNKPAIRGLTKRIVKLMEREWERLVARLERFHLIHVKQKGFDKESIDTHPLIRDYFAKQLNNENLEGWREAHRRLYEYLTTSTVDKPAPTLEELQPLYQAVAHGCKAGLQHEAIGKVYINRILKGTKNSHFYSIKKLGAIGTDLGVVACFFEELWNKPSSVLPKNAKAWLLNQCAMLLRCLGRLKEAIEPTRAGLEMVVSQKDWINAAQSANNLCELEVTMGEIENAVQDGKRSVEFADKSGNAFQRLDKRSTLADCLHQAGKIDDAFILFREAETMHAARNLKTPILYSIPGFVYCDLILTTTERIAWQEKRNPESGIKNMKIKKIGNIITDCREVERRGKEVLRLWKEVFTHASLLDLALDHLTLGRACFYLSILDPFDSVHRQSAIDNIYTAVNGLRASGIQDFLPRSLLTRAWLRYLENDHPGSSADLDEAQQIAERGSMKLHLADVHLYRGRLSKDKNEIKKAHDLIEECGYWRRKGELEDAEAELGLRGFAKGIDIGFIRENDQV